MKNEVFPELEFRLQIDSLSRSLAELNSRIEPQLEVFSALQRAEQLQKQTSTASVRMTKVAMVQFEELTFLALELDQSVQVSLLKLFDPHRSMPLLASFGAHSPGNIACAGNYVFAFASGMHLQTGQFLELEILLSGNQQFKAVVGVSSLSEEVLTSLTEIFRGGRTLLDDLLARNLRSAPNLHKLHTGVMEYEEIYESPYSGSVDAVQGRVVEGWVWCPSKPKNRYEVQAWSDGRLVGFTVANRLRDDLARRKKSDGHLKFELTLSDRVCDGQLHWIQLRVIGQGELDRTLEFSKPIRFRLPKTKRAAFRLEGLMGYDLDQKVAKALSFKFSDPNKQTLLLENTPKISHYLENGYAKEARDMVSSIINSVGSDGFLTLKIAESYLVEKKLVRALELFAGLARAAKKFIWGHLGLGYTLVQLNRYQEALVALEAAHAISPYYPGLKQQIEFLTQKLTVVGDSSVDRQKLAAEIVRVRRALVLDPDNQQLSQMYLNLISQRRPHLRGPDLEGPAVLPETRNLQHARALLEALGGMLRAK